MADNTTLATGSGGDVIRDVDRAGVKTQIVGIDLGIGTGTESLMSGTMPVSAGSLPLPSGASTLTAQNTSNTSLSSIDGKLPSLGQALAAASVPVVLTAAQLSTLTPLTTITAVTTVGTITNVVHVDDNSGSLTVDGTVSVSGNVPGTSATSLGKAEDAVAADGDTGVMVLAVRKDTAATTVGADGDYHPLEVDANGRLWVTSKIDTALPAGTNAIGKLAANSGVTIGAVEIASAQTLATVTTVGTVTTVSTVTNLSQMGGVAIAMNTGARAAGVQRVTICTDDVVPASQSGTWTVQPGNTANTTPWLVTDTPATSGGLSVASYIPTGASNQDQTSVKGSAGQLYGYAIFNTTSSIRYVKLYNASAPTSASTPVLRLMVPASGGLNVTIDMGIAFGTAIGMRCTTGAADNDANAVTTNDLLVNLWYK